MLDMVDHERYPVHSPALVNSCREALRRDGLCQLDGFLLPAAVDEMISLASALATSAWATDNTHTIYFEPPDNSVPADHPRAMLQRSAKRAIAYDHIPVDAPIRRLYESDDLTRFIAAVLEKDTLYRSADPLDALEIATFADGEELGWHFDRSEFSVTVMYQQSDDGGHFEYCRPSTLVPNVLHGDTTEVIRPASSPGTLALFHGQHALHRVTQVSGMRPRINSVLTYGEQPGMKLNALTQTLFYGRTA
jgi:hypothetical protein